ncbi:hypothetical protein KDH_61060 [Dictyobacter sp. S3.2.2.5]|uniref:Uncharacterized protein n=1 Tax=Dictyobacter halimunensis TaxID=3026934 RepID=A0ABQ6FZM8_9CHLR|nr:hypothetical protein KDH_61060 [Dictyobacter sp. S3.2.2.5]
MLTSPFCVDAWGAHLRTPCINTKNQCGRAADARAGALMRPHNGGSQTHSQ